MTRGMRKVSCKFIYEKKGTVALEQLPEDPEYFHVYNGEDLVLMTSDISEARETFKSLCGDADDED